MSVRAAASPFAASVVVLAMTLAALGVPAAAQDGNALGFPPSLDLTDPGLLKGQTHRATLHYQVLYEDPVEATFDVVPRTPQAGDMWSDASGWVRVAPAGTTTIAPTDDYPLEVAVSVPPTAANGEYRAGVRIRVAPSGGPEGSGAGVEQSGTTILVLRVTGEEVKRVESPGRPEVRDVEVDGPWTLLVPLANTGNVRANPHIKVDVWDQMRTRVVATLWANGTSLDPGESSSYALDFRALDLPLGQYWAVVEVFMDGVSVAVHRPVTFDVVEQGSLKRLLELRTIRVAEGAAWVDTGSLVAVAAMVRNVGELPVDAVLRLKVERDGKLVDAIDSDPLEVPVGEERAVEILYRVEKAGKYAFVGQVRYGNKVTEERTTFLNVQGDGAGTVWPWVVGGMTLAALGVGAVLMRRRASATSGPRTGPRTRPKNAREGTRARPRPGAPRPGARRPASPGARPPSRPPRDPRR